MTTNPTDSNNNADRDPYRAATSEKEFDLTVATKIPPYFRNEPYYFNHDTYVDVSPRSGANALQGMTVEKNPDGTNKLHYTVQGTVLVDAPVPMKGDIHLHGSHDVTIHHIPEGGYVGISDAGSATENKSLGFDDKLTVGLAGLKGGHPYVSQDRSNEQYDAQFNQILTPEGKKPDDIATLDFNGLDVLKPDELEKLRDSFIIHTTGKGNTAILTHLPAAGIQLKHVKPGIGEHDNKVEISFKGVPLGTLDGYDNLQTPGSTLIDDFKKQGATKPPAPKTIEEGTGLPASVDQKPTDKTLSI